MPAIGTDFVTSLSRRHIMPTIVDNIYGSNALLFRMRASGRTITGGTQIEVPIMYAQLGSGGPYSGFDVLNTAPTDTVKNLVFDWKQHYVPVTIDGRTLIRLDSPDAIANGLKFQFAQADMQMAANLGTGIYSDGSTNPKEVTGLQLAVDSAGTYGGIARASATYLQSYEDGSTTVLGLSALQTAHGTATSGGRHPTLIVSQQANYNRYWNLAIGSQVQDIGAGGKDEQLAAAGFHNICFNGVPWIVDSQVHNSTTIYMLNEDYLFLASTPRADFTLQDFQSPHDQDAMTALILWAGELICTNPSRQAKFTAIAA
jgi:hypothetical protein